LEFRNKELEETKELLKENEEDLAMTNRALEECKLESAILKTNFENVILHNSQFLITTQFLERKKHKQRE
jgi:hypothetical protein